MFRIVFIGTPDFAVPGLRKLIETQTVVGVVTQPDRPAGRGRHVQPPPVKAVAEAAGIPVYQPASLRGEAAAGPLREWRPDALVVAAFGQLLRPHVLNLPPLGCLNVHASLLPRWRGASPIQHAILAGDEQTGISLMRMDVGLDTGPVYVQQALAIPPQATAGVLHDHLAQLGAEMLGEYLEDILSGRLAARPQDNSQATYAPMIQKEDGRLDWRHSAVQLDRRIRAMAPWPGAFTTWKGQLLKVLAARPLPSDGPPSGSPGQVIAPAGRVAVWTGEGVLELLEVQLEGKRPMRAADFARGRPEWSGAILL